VQFEEELAQILPADLPQRAAVIAKAAKHLDLIVEMNKQFNLTRITTPREAAIKHVADIVLPWRVFEGARQILDAGTGAGFPGIPLAIVLPDVHFTLAEATQKKARFVQSVVDELELPNVTVWSERAEDVIKNYPFDLITARALAPLSRALGFFAPALRNGTRAILYKGPDAETEIAEANAEARKRQIHLRLLEKYELPDAMGTRTMVGMSR
jgi:16S rRNA (guanine527-N7)-methyltransferase